MQEKSKEKNIDLKATIAKFVEADEPEMTQEETIMKYGEEKNKKKSSYSDSSEDETSEEEHLKRIKKELIASLERVKAMAKKIYGERDSINKTQKLKVSKGTSSSIKKDLQENKEQKENGKERE